MITVKTIGRSTRAVDYYIATKRVANKKTKLYGFHLRCGAMFDMLYLALQFQISFISNWLNIPRCANIFLHRKRWLMTVNRNDSYPDDYQSKFHCNRIKWELKFATFFCHNITKMLKIGCKISVTQNFNVENYKTKKLFKPYSFNARKIKNFFLFSKDQIV